MASGPHMEKLITKESLENLLAEAKEQAASRVMQLTEQGRMVGVMHVRLIETLLYGEPKTQMPSRHNA